jgi:hypothetical protein
MCQWLDLQRLVDSGSHWVRLLKRVLVFLLLHHNHTVLNCEPNDWLCDLWVYQCQQRKPGHN